MIMYQHFALWSFIHCSIELFGERSKDQWEFVESEFLLFPCIEIYHMIVLYSSYCRVVWEIFAG